MAEIDETPSYGYMIQKKGTKIQIGNYGKDKEYPAWSEETAKKKLDDMILSAKIQGNKDASVTDYELIRVEARYVERD